MKTTLTTLAMIAALSGSAFASEEAACTGEMLQAKAIEAVTAMQEVAATKPEVIQEIAADIQDIQTKAATASDGDYTELCAEYDKVIEKLKE